uniref:Carboxypeptidase n=2 Tax=Odontella aurita TaxID=265563 RepID=A0A7S4HSQ4_9STRA|mmetsp:Transcript_14608/g.42825  ORF Transcript_14608/g.42825 Transcript_14608/m.42825 type:complete len:352 (+) Transcript_14608:667-1722(+)
MRRPLYFSGESHAGHYIPSMMDYILAREAQPNRSNPQDGGGGGGGNGEPLRVLTDLRGAAIGNGWTDPYHQYAAARAAYGHGLIGLSQQSHLDELEEQCLKDLDDGKYRSGVCFRLLDDITRVSHGDSSGTVACKYDVSKYLPRGQRGLFPPGHKLIEAYLGGGNPPHAGRWDVGDYKAQVLSAIHASESADAGQRFRDCTDPPYRALAHQDGLGVVNEVSRILDFDGGGGGGTKSHGPVRLLFFNGMNDLVCNHVGNEVALQKLPWSRSGEWTVAPRYAWRLGDDNNVPPVGFIQETGNLSFLKIPNAGHMVPMDQPVVALEMIRTFIYGRSFKSSKQNMEGSNPAEKSC